MRYQCLAVALTYSAIVATYVPFIIEEIVSDPGLDYQPPGEILGLTFAECMLSLMMPNPVKPRLNGTPDLEAALEIRRGSDASGRR